MEQNPSSEANSLRLLETKMFITALIKACYYIVF